MSHRSLQIHPDSLEKAQTTYKTSGHTNQADFAASIGFHVDTLRKFLQGKSVDRDPFMKFCEALELDHQEMIEGAPSSTTSNSTNGTQINQSVDINNGFMIGTIGTFNQS